MFEALQGVLIYGLSFITVISLVIFVHEMGHFLVGRWCGVRVETFSLGFGRELFHFYDSHGTRWRMGAVLLGGYVKFFGDSDAASTGTASQNLTPQERAATLEGQALWKRAAIVAAGPIANFIFAIAIFGSMFFIYGQQVLQPRIASVLSNSAAEKAGFKAGDMVKSIDGKFIEGFADVHRIVATSAERPLTFVVDRAGVATTIVATPDAEYTKSKFGTAKNGRLGLAASQDAADMRYQRYGALESLKKGVEETVFITDISLSYLGRLIMGRESPSQLSGPAGIAHVSGEMAKVSLPAVINLIAIVSVSIGLMNLFIPIPPLDGSHLAFFALEAIRGKPVGTRVREISVGVGLAFIATLMLFSTYNDIMRIGPQLMNWIQGS